jgi:opacity protein-like surface antigen
MKKLLLAFLILAGCMGSSFAQDGSEKKGFDKSRLFVGGYFGLGFSTYTTSINITPQVGYFFTQWLAAGVGINYAYYHYNYSGVQTETYSYAGMNLFGRIYPIRQLFIQVQPEINYIWGNVSYAGYPEAKIPSQFVPSLLLGGGAALPAGRGSIVISLMYDVIQNTYSPYYGQPVYSFGYNIGF